MRNNTQNVIETATASGNEFSELHAATFPLAFAEWAVQFSPQEAVVLDPFAGTGTTAIACENLGRSARLVELDPAYCDVIVDRWQRHTEQEAIRP